MSINVYSTKDSLSVNHQAWLAADETPPEGKPNTFITRIHLETEIVPVDLSQIGCDSLSVVRSVDLSHPWVPRNPRRVNIYGSSFAEFKYNPDATFPSVTTFECKTFTRELAEWARKVFPNLEHLVSDEFEVDFPGIKSYKLNNYPRGLKTLTWLHDTMEANPDVIFDLPSTPGPKCTEMWGVILTKFNERIMTPDKKAAEKEKAADKSVTE
jgi:hypothetical protein